MILELEYAKLNVERALLDYAVFAESEDLKLREAEITCMMNTGGVGELENYFEAATKNTDAKRTNLLKTVWKRILDFINKIKKMIFFKKINKKVSDVIFAVSKAGGRFVNGIKSAWQKAKPLFIKCKEKIKNHKVIAALLLILGVKIGKICYRRLRYGKYFKKQKELNELDAKYNEDLINKFEEIKVNGDKLYEAYMQLEDMTNTMESISKKGASDPESVDSDNTSIINQTINLVNTRAKELQKALNIDDSFYDQKHAAFTIAAYDDVIADTPGKFHRHINNHIDMNDATTDLDNKYQADRQAIEDKYGNPKRPRHMHYSIGANPNRWFLVGDDKN